MIKVFGDGAKKAVPVSDLAQVTNFRDGPFTGMLSAIPFDQLCQMIEETARTGLLQLNVGGSNAIIYVHKGDVVLAEYNGQRGQLAFNQFCRWEGTYFLFQPGLGPPKPGPPSSIMRMLLEACEVRDQGDRA